VGGKNKELANMKRRQKAAEKAKVRRATKKYTPASPVQGMGNQSGIMNVSLEDFPEEAHLFWLAHGVNCIVSDYDKGTWSPLFEGIYEGNSPDPESIAQAIMDKYNVNDKEWPVEAKSALAWTVTERHVVYVYYREAIRRLTAAHGGDADIESMSRQPHNPIVWAMFAYLKEKTLKRK